MFTLSFAESEVCKLETLLQTEVSVVTTGEAVGADAAKTPPGLRRRKRACSRRQGERERDREGGGMGADRGDRGIGEERDRRDTSKSGRMQLLKRFHPFSLILRVMVNRLCVLSSAAIYWLYLEFDYKSALWS